MIMRATALALLAASAAVLQAHAQTSPRVVNPNRPDQNAPGRPNSPAGRPLKGVMPKARNPETPIRPFVLKQVQITGSSTAVADLERAYAGYIGQTVDNDVLAKITQAVAATYDKRDLALYTVFVPEQTFAGGSLKLLVVEGYIQSTRVNGKLNNGQKRLLSAYVAKLLAGRPLKQSVLQRYVSLIRDIPGLYPNLNLERGNEQGAVRLVIDAKPKPVQAAVGISNRGTAFLGQTQVQGDVFLNSLITGGDQLRGTVVLPTEPRLFQYYSLSYTAPINTSGTTVQVNTGYLRTRPALIPLTGDATTFGVVFSHPLIRGYNKNLYVTAGIDGVNANSVLLGSTISNDHVRAGRLAASFTKSSDRNVLTLSGTVSRGLNIFGGRVTSVDAANPAFTKLNVKLIDNIQISKHVILRLDGFGQYSRDRLPSSEQVALGGDEFGRAYEAALISGDSGLAGSAEVAYRPERLPPVLKGSEAYLFTDGGRTWTQDRFGFGGYKSDLASVGAGARLQLAQRSVLQLEAAKGLTNPVFYEDRRAWRLLVNFRTLF